MFEEIPLPQSLHPSSIETEGKRRIVRRWEEGRVAETIHLNFFFQAFQTAGK